MTVDIIIWILVGIFLIFEGVAMFVLQAPVKLEAMAEGGVVVGYKISLGNELKVQRSIKHIWRNCSL